MQEEPVTPEEPIAAAVSDGELFYRLARRAAGGGLLFVDVSGIVRGWTDSARQLFGCGAEAVVGRPLTALVPFAAEGATVGWCRRVDGAVFRGELVCIGERNVELLAPIVIVDVSAREDAAARERAAARQAALAAFRVNLATGEVEVSDGFAQLFGFHREAPPRRIADWLALCHPDDRALFEARLAEAIGARDHFEAELRLLSAVGERWLRLVGRVVAEPRLHVIGGAVDVSVRRRAEQESAAHAERLQAVLDLALDGIMTLDETGCVESANRGLGAMLRRPPSELIGVRWQTLLDVPSGRLPAPDRLHELHGRRSDGSTFPVECSFTTLPLGSRRLVLAVVRDITERRLLERQVLDVSEQLQRQIGQDLHDGLGQLLTGTAFLAKGLMSYVAGEYQPQAQRVVELINQAITRVRSLARGLSPIHVEAQGLEGVLRNVVAESSTLLGVSCVLELRDPVETDRPATLAQLCLIAREAITNAVRHGQAHRIVVTLAREGTRSLLSIADDGSGIAPSDERREGLGLRSMRHRARLIGGTLEVARAPVGTVVRCWWNE